MRILVAACAVLGTLALGSGTASAASPSQCHNQAMAYANKYANPAGGALAGGVIGAIGGGILGEVIGQGKGAVGAGALIGGGTGAVIGASKQKKKHQQLYDQAYYDCMNQPPPQPIYYEIPPAGTPEWNYACSQKYISFQAASGTFQPKRPYPEAQLPPRRVCVLP
jgi:uncharacterized protein YcfJ